MKSKKNDRREPNAYPGLYQAQGSDIIWLVYREGCGVVVHGSSISRKIGDHSDGLGLCLEPYYGSITLSN